MGQSSLDPDPGIVTRRQLLLLGGILPACAVFLALAGEIGSHVEALYPDQLPPRPYFVPEHALVLYLVWPLAALAAMTVIVYPGICLALLRRHRRDLLPFALEAFTIGVLVQALAHAVVRGPVPADRPPGLTAATMVATGALSWLALAALHARWPVTAPWVSGDGRRLAWLAGLPVLAAALLVPVLCWQDFNPDGLEAYTAGRSLLSHMLPLLPNGHPAGLGLGMMTEAFPVHWFMVWLGPVEAAARLPLLLVLPFLFAGLVALAEHGAARRLGPGEEGALTLALAAVVVTIVYNDSYHAYSADIASPGAIDLLACTWILGVTVALVQGDALAFALCALLGSFTRPTMVLWLGMLVAAGVLVAPVDRRRLAWLAAGIIGCLGAGILVERVVGPLAGLDFEQGSGALLHRLRFLRLTDVRRLAFLVVPAGIAPALALLAWRRLDAPGRVLVLATLGYFAFFYLVAFTAVHHFLPAMLVPLAVLWRLALAGPPARGLTAAAAAGAAVALVLGLPRTFVVDRSMRVIGAETDYRVGDYRDGYAGYRAAFEGRNVLAALFPAWDSDADPIRERIGHPWVQVHYAAVRAEGASTVNYVVQPAAASPPAGFTRIARDSIAALYVRDLDRWRRARATPPRTDYRSALYDLPRTTLLEEWGGPARAYDVDVRALLGRLRARGTGGP